MTLQGVRLYAGGPKLTRLGWPAQIQSVNRCDTTPGSLFRSYSTPVIPQSSSELKVLRDESKDVQVLLVVRTLGFAGTGRVLFLSGGL